METTGIVLAAGAGTRAGGPKALRREPDGTPWVEAACAALLGGGCDRVVVVLGAQAERARPLVPEWAATVTAARWDEGMSSSLRAGLAEASGDAVLITLVDLPTLPAAVVARVMETGTLAQATYGGRPGHPVLIPTKHWADVAACLRGDSGAREYLTAHGALRVECGDLWDGFDRDEQ